jgi:hypothetical protein
MVCMEVPSVDTLVWARWRQKGQSMKVGVAVNLDSGVTICGSGSDTIGGISM